MSEPQPSDRERMTFPHHPRPAGGISNTLANTKLHILNDLVWDELASSVRFRTPVSKNRTPTHSPCAGKDCAHSIRGVSTMRKLPRWRPSREVQLLAFLTYLLT